MIALLAACLFFEILVHVQNCISESARKLCSATLKGFDTLLRMCGNLISHPTEQFLNSQHEKRDLRKIKVGLNLLKVGYLTLRHELNFHKGV